MGSDGMLVVEAREKGGYRSAKDITLLVSELTGLFAGGEIDDEEKDGIMAALNQAYWLSKNKNQKYTPNKYKA